MSAQDNGTEYIFIDHEGGEHFGIVFSLGDAEALRNLYNAKISMPLARWERSRKETPCKRSSS